ncbi:MAG: TolC family protein [Bacteroidales bacterium]|nr:TolC family protein [Bacteroidales bacterium]
MKIHLLSTRCHIPWRQNRGFTGSVLTLFLIVLSSSIISAQEQPAVLRLSLDDAQQYAVSHNYSLQNASLEVQKAEYSRWQTLASMLPQIKAGFDYQNMCGYEMVMGGGNSYSSLIPDTILIGGVPVPISIPSSGEESSGGTVIPMNPSGTFSITASVAVTGAQIVGLMLSNIAREMTDVAYKQTEQTTRSQVRSVYVSILVMEDIVGLLDSSLANMQRLEQTTIESVRVGAAEQIAADQLSVQVASLRNSINANRRSLQMLYNSLILQLGADVNTKIELTTSLDDVLDINHLAQLTMQDFNIEDNYNYQLLQYNERVAKRNITMAWMDFTPTLSAYYQYSAKTYFGKDAGFNMTPPNMIGASISLPLFSSGTRFAKIKAAEIDYAETLNSKQQAEDGLRVQYNQLCFDLVNALETYQIQKANLDVTRRVFANITEKYNYGRASNLEVTNASTDIITAQSNYIQAVMSVVSAQVALENLLGK